MTQRVLSAPLLPLADAITSLTAELAPVGPCSRAINQTFGAVAAGDVVGLADAPRGLTALRDGWAVPATSVMGAAASSPVPLARLPEWIQAGETLPEGADTVLPPEAVDDGAAVADAPRHDGVRDIGGDVRAGERLAAAGERLTALHVLALAAAGLDRVDVRVPRIGLVINGAGQERGPDAVSAALTAMICAAGGTIAWTRRVSADPEVIAAAIGAATADAVLVLCGAGDGRTDVCVAALARAGAVFVHGVALRPGEAAAFGEAGGRRVLLLPGRPEAAISAFLALGRPLLGALAGFREPPLARGPLLRKISSAIGLSEIIFVQRTSSGVEPLGGLDIPLRRLARADGAVLVPPEREGYPEGTNVEIIAL